jgi:serine/threonine protein kinase/Tol biopolymer transport system component
MGDVYRARDLKLRREVALKVLADAVRFDPTFLERFQHEARILASLSHPNIAAIFGIEDESHLPALVLELVEGETLAERIARGPIDVDAAMTIATQVADALKAAHTKGLVHRDLKPANIAIMPTGVVKVLDFGVAKITGAGNATSDDRPTAPITIEGIVVGTVAYMSPEQAQGHAIDRRTDIWAFGCVLFEMLTGRRLFQGQGVVESLAAVLTKEPDWNALPPQVPSAIHTLLRRCLDRDVLTRLDDVAAIQFVLKQVTANATADLGMASIHRVDQGLRAALIAAAVVGVAMLAGSLWVKAPAERQVVRSSIVQSPATALSFGPSRDMTFTPDGSRLVYVGDSGRQLFVRSLDALEATPIARGTFVKNPCVSPDGQWVVYGDSAWSLKKVSITGGTPVPIAAIDGALMGATWLRDDTIVFATNNLATGLQRVPAAGGTPQTITTPDAKRGESDHILPEALPEGDALLFITTARANGDETAQAMVHDLRTHTNAVVMAGTGDARFVPGSKEGHLVYTSGNTLRAIAFDPKRGEVAGSAVVMIQRVLTRGSVGAWAVAPNGTLVYVDPPPAGSAIQNTLVWVDRTGREEPISAPPRAYVQARVAPDGARLVLTVFDQQNDLWTWDLERQTMTRLTVDPGIDAWPVWTPDSRRIVFASMAGGPMNLWWRAADGSGTPERLTTNLNFQSPTGISPDGTRVVLHETTSTGGTDLFQVTLDSPHHVSPLVRTRAAEGAGVISPDGQWLAYASDDGGTPEVWVRSYRDPAGARWQVSNGGGAYPLWSREGAELLFETLDGGIVGRVVEAKGGTWSAGAPRRLVEPRYLFVSGITGTGRAWDVGPDGRRFIMIKPDPAISTSPIVIVQNWDVELDRLVRGE